MKWIIYKTTCRCNGKIYIGQHKTDDIEDGYLGSGKLITRAIEKYGRDNFDRLVLEECNTFDLAREREEYYIKEYNSCSRSIGYNITEYAWGGQPHTKSTRKKIGDALRGRILSEERREKLRKPKPPRSLEHIRNLSNSMIGKVWYNNPMTLESKKFGAGETIPNGWVKGRGNTQKKDRKPPTYPIGWLQNVRDANKSSDKKNRISTTLKNHTVSSLTRTKISHSLKVHYEKTRINPTNHECSTDTGS